MLVTAVGVPELAPLPSRSPLFATNFDSTACTACCEEYSDAAFASRIARAADARLTRDRWVPTLSRENRWLGGKQQIFHQIYTGPKFRFVTEKFSIFDEMELDGKKNCSVVNAFAVGFEILRSSSTLSGLETDSVTLLIQQ